MSSAAGLAVAANAAGAVTAWFASAGGAQSELHCSELPAVSGWCRSVRHEAQRCSSRTRSGYMLTSVLTKLAVFTFQ